MEGEPRKWEHWGVSRARTFRVSMEAQGTSLAGSLVSSAQAIETTGVIRLGPVGQVQNVELCSDFKRDGQPLKGVFKGST